MSKQRGGKAIAAKGEHQTSSSSSNSSQKGSNSSGNLKLDDSQKEERIATVSALTSWPVEDVKRVLEDANWNTDLAVSNILDGFAGKPQEDWQTASSKRSAPKDKEQKAKEKAASRRAANKDNQAGNRRANFPGEKQDKSKGQTPKQNTVDTTVKENGHVGVPANTRPPSELPASTKEPENLVDNKIAASSTPPITVETQQPQQTANTQPSVTPQQAAQSQKGSPKDQRSPVSRPQPAQNLTAQKPQAAQPPVQQKPQQPAQPAPTSQPESQSVATPSAAPQTATSSQQQATPSSASAYSSKGAYFPASMVWKPRNGQPPSPQVPAASSVSQTQQPVSTSPAVSTVKSTPVVTQSQSSQQQPNSPVNTAAQPSATTQSSVTNLSHPSYTTSMYSNSPVILPAKANENIQDIAFGTLGITPDYENPSQYLNASDLSSKSSISSASSTYIDSSATGERTVDHTRINQYAPTLESEGHPIHPYTYIPPFMPFPYNPYEAGIYDQQAFQAQQPYQREPSPSESAKFSTSQRGSTSNQQYRDPKYSNQDGSVSQTQTASPQPAQAQQPSPSSPVQQHFYGSPMYGYPPYLPNQYSYQTAQASQYYRHPYMRGYPNFSNTSGTFPPTPSATASSLATGYPEDLVNQDYSKFPPYYSPEMSTMMTGNKAPQQVGQQVATGVKGQNYPQTAQSAQDLSSTSYKPTQQPDYSKTYQNSSYYNIAQQYSQTNQTNYPPTFLQQPQSQSQQAQAQYSRQQSQPQQTYLPENKNF